MCLLLAAFPHEFLCLLPVPPFKYKANSQKESLTGGFCKSCCVALGVYLSSRPWLMQLWGSKKHQQRAGSSLKVLLGCTGTLKAGMAGSMAHTDQWLYATSSFTLKDFSCVILFFSLTCPLSFLYKTIGSPGCPPHNSYFQAWSNALHFHLSLATKLI